MVAEIFRVSEQQFLGWVCNEMEFHEFIIPRGSSNVVAEKVRVNSPIYNKAMGGGGQELNH